MSTRTVCEQKEIKSMKKTLIAIVTILTLVSQVSSARAATYTERECSTDNYGNTTCRDKVTNVETGVITYTNETVTKAVASTGVAGQEIKILNTATPAFVPVVATLLVALGAVSMVIKNLRRQVA